MNRLPARQRAVAGVEQHLPLLIRSRRDQIAYSGLSFGASTVLPVLAMEPGFKAAVLILAGVSSCDMLPDVDAVNFVPRITIPVLMIGAAPDATRACAGEHLQVTIDREVREPVEAIVRFLQRRHDKHASAWTNANSPHVV